MLALIVAMEEELKDIRRVMDVDKGDESGNALFYSGRYKGKNLLLARTGVGKQNVQLALKYLLDLYPVTAIFSTGFAGALKPDLRAGDVVVYTSVIYADNPSAAHYTSDPRLLELARACSAVTHRCGAGVTGPSLVTNEKAKRELGEATMADVVDMESYWIMQTAEENRVPAIVVRSVSDAMTDSLPELPSWRHRDVVPHFMMHPGQGFSLYRAIVRARRSISAFADYLIQAVG
jgi:adenosylhomocysteine nucleosidase